MQTGNITTTIATDFASDDLLRNRGEAGKLSTEELNIEYKYGGVFARLTGNLHDTYILNFTGRADGSSRFGPGKQVGNFWAAGAGWIFSNEPFVKDNIPLLSYGKLRGSYGITGNDQIGDYKYLDQWQRVSYNYQGSSGIVPVQLADSNYSWEVNRKLEVAADLGVFKDHLMLSVAWYRNRTGNQLIAYTLPAITGFNKYAAKNSPALVQNTGWEIMLQTRNKPNKNFRWNGMVSVTIPRNKLLSFPDLNNSTYAGLLQPGQSLSVLNGFTYTGVNAATGLFTFEDKDKNGTISYPNDYRVIGNLGLKWYGGIQSDVQYKGWRLSAFVEYRNQSAYSYLYTIYNNNGTQPGTILVNQPVTVLDRWQKTDHQGTLQQFSTGANDAAGNAIAKFIQSSGIIDDASFWRLRNVEFSYSVPCTWLRKTCMKRSRVYVQAQNLFTITPYKGIDPETQNIFALPPLRTIAAGVEISF
jgi:hypothetical protein